MDDLLDLDWDKKPPSASSSVSHQPSSASSASTYRAPGAGSSYNFDALTRSMPSTAASRPPASAATPSYAQQSASAATTTTRGNAASATTGDAFSSLFAGASTGGASKAGNGAGSSNLPMAQRLQGGGSSSSLLSSTQKSVQKPSTNGDAWSGLESLGVRPPANRAPPPSSTAQKKQAQDDFFQFDTFASSSSPVASGAPTIKTNAALAASAPKTKSKDPFDFSEFEDPGDSQSSALGGGNSTEGPRGRGEKSIIPNRPSQSKSSATFRGAGLLGDEDNYDDGIDDGILGVLGHAPSSRPLPPRAASGSLQSPATASRAASPPPHIIGQVVEMGFSPLEAREALAKTGNDVSAALEQLLARSNKPSRPPQSHQEQEDRRYAERLQQREQQGTQQRPSRNGIVEGREGAAERRRRFQDGEGNPSEEAQVDWQKQADQLYAHASELGASVFSKANAFWTTAKAQAQRAMEEHGLDGVQQGSAASSGRNSPASGSDRAKSRRWAVPSRDGRSTPRKEWEGKPRWMVEAEAAAAAEEEGQKQGPKPGPVSSFRDDDGVDNGDAARTAPSFLAGAVAPREAGRTREESPRDLWDTDVAPSASSRPSSSASARPPQGSKSRQGVTPAAAAAAAAAPSNVRRPPPMAKTAAPTRIVRAIEEDGASAIEASKKHKARGNEHFKKGAYGEAETAYSAGLDALDAHPKSLRRVPLLNNRANARLKNGDARNVLADTKDVLVLIVAAQGAKSPFTLYRPSGEAPLPAALAQEVNLRDSYAKALLRRAQAEEMLEQWDTARSVWTLLERYEKEEGSGTAGVTNLRAAQAGSQRCQKMLLPADAEVQPKEVKRKVDRATARAVAKAEESARQRIRAENAATAAEEAAKLALRDGVDARILAWKGGKEANVRALLASLQDVVWDGLGWKKVGMHELVTDAQVKRNYMKAIGKLHPDKLTPRNNSLEERLIGGAVFSVLNDAWSAQF